MNHRVSKREKKNKSLGYTLILPLLAGCMIFYVIPMCMVFVYSFWDGTGKGAGFVGMENYRNLLQNKIFRVAFGNTLRFLLTGLPVILVVSYMIALYFRKHIKKDSFVHMILLTPYIMPVVGTMVLVELFFAKSGWTSQILSLLGLPVRDWLESRWAFWIVILLYLWKNTGYSVILLLSGLFAIPNEHYESADMDGANSFQKFLYITMPQMRESVFLAFLFSLINAFKCFREIFLIGGKHPNIRVYMLQHFLNNCFENLNYAKMSASSILLFGVTVIVVGSIRWRMTSLSGKQSRKRSGRKAV